MKKQHIILILLLSLQFLPAKAQQNSYHIQLDSFNVINNAAAMRSDMNGTYYVMMPTQYNTNIANGQLLLIMVESIFLLDNVRIYYYNDPNLVGLVVTDLAIGENNKINFVGYRNGMAAYGIVDGNNTIHVIYDNNSTSSEALSYRSFSGTGGFLLTGDHLPQGRSRLTSFSSSSTLTLDTVGFFRDVVSTVDVVLSHHLTLSTAYGMSLSRANTQGMAIAKHDLGDLSTALGTRKMVSIPANWSWHEGGGSIVRINNDRYVAVIDVRCDTVEKDGVWFVKFAVSSNGINIYDSKLLEFPSQKVIVKDMCFTDDMNHTNQLVVSGQYIDETDTSSWCGCPFVLQIDTSFGSWDVKKYATHYLDFERHNYQLNRLFFDKISHTLVAAGSYCGYGQVTIGGIYIASIDPFTTIIPTYPCTLPIPVTDLAHEVSSTNMLRMGTVSHNMSSYTAPYNNRFSGHISLDCIPVYKK